MDMLMMAMDVFGNDPRFSFPMSSFALPGSPAPECAPLRPTDASLHAGSFSKVDNLLRISSITRTQVLDPSIPIIIMHLPNLLLLALFTLFAFASAIPQSPVGSSGSGDSGGSDTGSGVGSAASSSGVAAGE